MEYHVFISYQRDSSAALSWVIQEALVAEGWRVFLDLEDLHTKHGKFTERIVNAIADSAVFVCLLGEDTLQSEYVRQEIKQAYDLGRPMIPVMQRGFIPPTDPSASVQALLKHGGIDEFNVRSSHRESDLADLLQMVKRILQEQGIEPESVPEPEPQPGWARLGIGAVIGLVLGAILGVLGGGIIDGGPVEPTPLPVMTVPGEWQTNISAGASVAQNVTLLMENSSLQNEDLWVFVVPSNGRYYPQSWDNCAGAGTPYVDGTWEMRAVLGLEDEAGGIFDIVLATADTPEANRYLSYRLQAWCAGNVEAGYDDLPAGLTEVYRMDDVMRNPGIWELAPNVTNTSLEGRVTIDNVTEDDTVGAVETFSGNYQGTEDNIWVLVYPPHGRWYPQSLEPCNGNHIEQADGQWSASNVIFGEDPGNPFDVVVVTANDAANTYFNNQFELWCAAEWFPGLLTIELPDGIEEQDRVRVVRE